MNDKDKKNAIGIGLIAFVLSSAILIGIGLGLIAFVLSSAIGIGLIAFVSAILGALLLLF